MNDPTTVEHWRELSTRQVPRRPAPAHRSTQLGTGPLAPTLHRHRRHDGPLGPDPAEKLPRMQRLWHTTLLGPATDSELGWHEVADWLAEIDATNTLLAWAKIDGKLYHKDVLRQPWTMRLADGKRKRDPDQYHFSSRHMGYCRSAPGPKGWGQTWRLVEPGAGNDARGPDSIRAELNMWADAWRSCTHMPDRFLIHYGPMAGRPYAPALRFRLQRDRDAIGPRDPLHVRRRVVWRWGPSLEWRAPRFARRCRALHHAEHRADPLRGLTIHPHEAGER